MNLQRMIVIPPETFENLKNLILNDSQLSELDKGMKKILNEKKLSDTHKWHHYRQNLIKYLNVKKNRDVKKSLNTLKNVSANIQKYDKSVQSKKILKQNVEASPVEELEQSFRIPKKNVSRKVSLPIDDIFSTSSRFESIESNDEVDDEDDNISLTDENGEENLTNETTYDNDTFIRQQALEGHPKDVKIIKERLSMNPNEYRAFELNTGEQVNVPVPNQRELRSRPLKQTHLNFPIVKNLPSKKSKNKSQTSLHATSKKKTKANKRKSSFKRSTPIKKSKTQKGGSIRWQTYK